MTILKNLCVKNGSYTDRDGNTKNRWLTIGQLHSGNNGEYITIDSHINLAAFPRKEGDTRLMVSLFEPREKEGGQPRQAPAPTRSAQADFDDDQIPF